MTYTGHTVMRTLIRAHFSPAETTGQRYIYSGSTDGRIHVGLGGFAFFVFFADVKNLSPAFSLDQIWNLDGRIARVINRKETRPLVDPATKLTNDPAAPDEPRSTSSASLRAYCVVRDVSWHPYLPLLMSTSWGDGGGWGGGPGGGSVALHEWFVCSLPSSSFQVKTTMS
jgi:WD repeat-containing protein 23